MRKILIILGGFLAILLLVAFSIFGWITGTYNGMVQKQQQVELSWSQVETQYQRRYDLIPNLANATKGFLEQEREILDGIAQARTRYAGSPSGSPGQVQAAGQLEGFLSRLLVIVENYPNLKSDATVRGLMDEIAGTENRVAVARQRYNEDVRTYNITIKQFPANTLAGMFQFTEKPLFESTQNADKAPEVNLSIKASPTPQP